MEEIRNTLNKHLFMLWWFKDLENENENFTLHTLFRKTDLTPI